MKSKNLLEQLKNLPYFEKNTVYQLGLQLGLKDKTIDTYISRFLRYKEILPLKNGLYVSTDFFEKNRGDISYSFYLANILRPPSFISSWTALQYYNLATEAVYSISSVTLKVTRNYQTKAGNFSYQSIRKDLFTDFELVKGKFDFFIASPAKALFDLLYFRTRQFKGMNLEDIKKLIEELRIDLDEMDKAEQEKFYSMINKSLSFPRRRESRLVR
jgi:predicted transcriptional regulator of viral defense system